MPQRRQNSMVRTFTSFIFGVTMVPSPCSTSRHGTPRQPSSPASARPTGPPPTIRTGTFCIRAGVRVVDLARIGPGIIDELPKRLPGRLRIHHENLKALGHAD